MESTKTNGKDRVVKHLEIIQAVITRLAHDSFLVKGWSMSILLAGAILIARDGIPFAWPALLLAVPVLGFWGLDGYYLWKEKLFRAVYDDIRTRDETDFAMQLIDHKGKPRYWATVFSCTLISFYVLEALVVFGLFLMLSIETSECTTTALQPITGSHPATT